MNFVDRITVSRTGLKPSEFCHTWREDEAKGHLAETGHTFAEYLTSMTQPGKLFLDRDVYTGISPPSAEVLRRETALVCEAVQALVSRLSTCRNDLTFVIATRHGFCLSHNQYKLSFRPFVQGMRILYTHIPTVIRWVGQEAFWDMSVYKPREQLLATINGCKGHIRGTYDGRTLIPSCGTEPLMYVVQHVDMRWPLLNIPDNYENAMTSIPSIPERITTPKQRTFIHAIVECLGTQTSDDRKSWIAIGMALKREGPYFNEWLEFSKKSGKYVDERDCMDTWSSLKTDAVEGTCGMGTLCFHAKRDNPRKYMAATQQHSARHHRSASVVPVNMRAKMTAKNM